MAGTDALNGLWVSRLLRSADARAAAASRVMGLAIGFASLAIAALAAARNVMPGVDDGMEGWSLALSGTLVAGLLAAYAVSMRLAPARAAS
jgi:hypothetical protein